MCVARPLRCCTVTNGTHSAFEEIVRLLAERRYQDAAELDWRAWDRQRDFADAVERLQTEHGKSKAGAEAIVAEFREALGEGASGTSA
jgi:sirohydrochlorin ferrochelatase